MPGRGDPDRLSVSTVLLGPAVSARRASLAWEFVWFDPSDHPSMFGVVVSNMVHDFIVVLEAKLAVWAGTHLGSGHEFICSRMQRMR